MKDLHAITAELAQYLKNHPRRSEFTAMMQEMELALILKTFKDLPVDFREVLVMGLQIQNKDPHGYEEIRNHLKEFLKGHSQGTEEPLVEDEPENEMLLKYESMQMQWVQDNHEDVGPQIIDLIDSSCVGLDPEEITELSIKVCLQYVTSVLDFAKQTALMILLGDLESSEMTELIAPENGNAFGQNNYIASIYYSHKIKTEYLNNIISRALRSSRMDSLNMSGAFALVAARDSMNKPEDAYLRYVKLTNMDRFVSDLEEDPDLHQKFSVAVIDIASAVWGYTEAQLDDEIDWIPDWNEFNARFA